MKSFPVDTDENLDLPFFTFFILCSYILHSLMSFQDNLIFLYSYIGLVTGTTGYHFLGTIWK